MENKYFIPDIEDIHVGYELVSNLEKLGLGVGRAPLRISKDNISHVLSNIDNYEVLHLTKEQIEAEGWEYVKNMNKVDVDICHIFNKDNYMLGWFPLINKIALLVRDPSKAFDKNVILIEYNNTERYTGPCKDVNTFRKIIKLLEI